MDQKLGVISGKLEMLEQRERELLKGLEAIRIQKSTLYSERKSMQTVDLVPDVLLIIFEMFVEDQEEYSMDAARIISHVCHHWRQIAITHPPLWSKLVLGRGNYEINLDQVLTFLARAKGVVPLDLVVLHPLYQPPHIQGLLNPLQAVITEENLRRCRTLHWAWRDDSFTLFMTMLHTSSSFPQLTRLSLCSDPMFASMVDHPFSNNKGNAAFQTLRSLIIQDVRFEHVPLTAYSHLRTLELSFSGRYEYQHTVYLSRFRMVFEETRQLEELSLSNLIVSLDMTLGEHSRWEDAPGNWVVESTLPIPLPNLTRLFWHRPPSRHFYIFFLFFPCFQLESLQVVPDDKFKWENGRTSGGVDVSPETFANLTSSHPLIITFQFLTQIDIGSKIANPLRYILERMDFPSLHRLDIELDPSQKAALNRITTRDPPDLALPGVESIFRDPRLVGLAHLSLASTSLSSMQRIFKYTPSLEHLSLHDCTGSYDAICSLAGESCDCPHSASVDRSVKRLCPLLCTIELSECDDLDFRCLKALVLDRNVDRREEVAKGTSGFVGYRKIKPLGGKFKRAAQRRSPKVTQLLPSNDAMAKPVRITSLMILGCPGVSDMQAVELQDLVEKVIWS